MASIIVIMGRQREERRNREIQAVGSELAWAGEMGVGRNECSHR